MRTDDLLALEQSTESPYGPVGETGFLAVIREAAFAGMADAREWIFL